MSAPQATPGICADARHSATVTQGAPAQTTQGHTVAVHFAPGHPLFADHFPGAPVVPGSCLLDALGRVVAHHYGCPAPVCARNVRFRRFVPPGTHTCVVEPLPDGYRCTILVDGIPAMSGTLLTTALPSAAGIGQDAGSGQDAGRGHGASRGPAAQNGHDTMTSNIGQASAGGVRP